MPNNTLFLGVGAIVFIGLCWFGWKMSSRSAYESAEYTTEFSDGAFEIRSYPDLWLASTPSQIDAQGGDGGFMRLFRYISGNNQAEQKIAMTTPVFMESGGDDKPEQMGFVLPKVVVEGVIPEPRQSNVNVKKRRGGKFAVYRFSGRLDRQTRQSAENKLRDWMSLKDLSGSTPPEMAGYDPPWIPGPFRLNEVLIRLD